jgi:hypothetical protein
MTIIAKYELQNKNINFDGNTAIGRDVNKL